MMDGGRIRSRALSALAIVLPLDLMNACEYCLSLSHIVTILITLTRLACTVEKLTAQTPKLAIFYSAARMLVNNFLA